MQQGFVTPGRQDLNVPICVVKGGELLQRALIMLVVGYCCLLQKANLIQNFDPS